MLFLMDSYENRFFFFFSNYLGFGALKVICTMNFMSYQGTYYKNTKACWKVFCLVKEGFQYLFGHLVQIW